MVTCVAGKFRVNSNHLLYDEGENYISVSALKLGQLQSFFSCGLTAMWIALSLIVVGSLFPLASSLSLCSFMSFRHRKKPQCIEDPFRDVAEG